MSTARFLWRLITCQQRRERRAELRHEAMCRHPAGKKIGRTP